MQPIEIMEGSVLFPGCDDEVVSELLEMLCCDQFDTWSHFYLLLFVCSFLING